MNKDSTGNDSDGDSDGGQLLWKLLKFHFIGIDIGAKLGTVTIGIGIGIKIGMGSVETVLHITIIAICILGGLGIGIGQWKHTITSPCDVTDLKHASAIRLKVRWYCGGSMSHVSEPESLIQKTFYENFKCSGWCRMRTACFCTFTGGGGCRLYRSGTVNSKSLVSKVLLRIKQKFELTYAL